MIEPGQRRKNLGWGLFLFVVVGSVTAWFALDTGFRTDKEALTVAENIPADEFDRRHGVCGLCKYQCHAH